LARSLEAYEEWSQRRKLHPAYVESVRLMGKMFSVFSQNSGLVLDVGCGNDKFSGETYDDAGYNYARYSCSYFGIDPIAGTHRDFPFAKAVGEYLPFKSNKFDSVLMVTSLDHLFDPVLAIRESHRVLKNEGFLNIAIGLQQNSHREEDPFHLFLPSNAQMQLLLSPFFHVHMLATLQAPGLQSTFIKGMKKIFNSYACLEWNREVEENIFRDLLLGNKPCPHCRRLFE